MAGSLQAIEVKPARGILPAYAAEEPLGASILPYEDDRALPASFAHRHRMRVVEFKMGAKASAN